MTFVILKSKFPHFLIFDFVADQVSMYLMPSSLLLFFLFVCLFLVCVFVSLFL